MRLVWDGTKSKAYDSVERRWKGYKDVSPDIEFANLQEEALKKLGKPNEDDFSKWAKEQEQAEKEIRYVELERRLVKIPNHYEDDPRVTITTFENEDWSNTISELVVSHRVAPGTEMEGPMELLIKNLALLKMLRDSPAKRGKKVYILSKC